MSRHGRGGRGGEGRGGAWWSRTAPLGLALVALVSFGVACSAGVTLSPDAPYRCLRDAAQGAEGSCPDAEHFCGVDGVCRSRAVGEAYACQGDGDCGGGWRCGPAGTCVDPSQDALRTDAPELQLSVSRVFTGELPWSSVSAVGPGSSFILQSVSSSLSTTDATPLALADGRNVYAVVHSDQGFGTASEPLPRRLLVGRGEAPAKVDEVAAVRGAVWAIAGTQLSRFPWVAPLTVGQDAVGTLTGVHLPAVGSRLRVGQASWPLVAEFGPATKTYRLHDSQSNQATLPLTSDKFITDLVDTGGKYLYAAMDGALFALDRASTVTDLNDGNPAFSQVWQTVSIASPGRADFLTECSGLPNAEFFIRQVHVGENPDPDAVESPLLALEVQFGLEPSPRGTHWMRVDPDVTLGTCSSGMPKHIARGPCPVCGPAERLLDLQWGFGPTPAGTDESQLVSSCVRPDGDRVAYALRTDVAGYFCFRDRLRDIPPPVAAVRQRTHPTLHATASERHVDMREQGLSTTVSLTLDDVPTDVDVVGGSVMALHAGALYRDTPGLGLALYRRAGAGGGGAFPVGFVDGRPDWFVLDSGVVVDVDGEGQGPLGTVALPERTGLQAPFRGTVAPTSDGRTFLLLTAFDALLHADVTGAAQGKVGTLGVRSVPLPQVAIQSLAVDPTPAEGALLSGYVLTDNRLFSFRAVTDHRWDLEEVRVPGGEWVSLWMDQDRGRLGYRDGRVTSLPSGVQLAEPLPEQTGGVVDYAQYCGRSFLLTREGLYRLDADGDAVGHWQRLSPGGLEGDNGFLWRRLFVSADGRLFVFGATGLGVELRADVCGS